MEDFCYFNGSSPAAVQLTNFSDSPQWIPEGVALMKILEVEEFSEDSLLAVKTTEDLDFTKSINQELSIPDQEQFQHLLWADT